VRNHSARTAGWSAVAIPVAITTFRNEFALKELNTIIVDSIENLYECIFVDVIITFIVRLNCIIELHLNRECFTAGRRNRFGLVVGFHIVAISLRIQARNILFPRNLRLFTSIRFK